MLENVSKSITNSLRKKGIVLDEFADVYQYGFELLLSFLVSTGLIIIAGIILNRFIETLVFLLVFISLRSFTGGFHAMKYWICTVSTFGVYSLVMIVSSCVSVNFHVFYILFLFGSIILYIKAPVENPNKELTKKQKSKYKWISLALFFGLLLIGYVFVKSNSAVSSTICFTLIIDLTLMFVRTPKKKDFRNESESFNLTKGEVLWKISLVNFWQRSLWFLRRLQQGLRLFGICISLRNPKTSRMRNKDQDKTGCMASRFILEKAKGNIVNKQGVIVASNWLTCFCFYVIIIKKLKLNLSMLIN